MYLRRFVLLSFTVAVGSAWADVANINASERGWVCTPDIIFCPSPTNNGPTPGNDYLAGAISASNGSDVTKLRNWFEFAIPTLTGGTLTSATLNLDDSGHIGDDLTFSVYGLSNRPLAFNDVTGNPYGSVTTTDASTGTTITITLNAAALAAIGAQQGGDIFIGGIDSGENDSPCAADSSSCVVGDFAGSPDSQNTVLTLITTPATVPEPSTSALLVTMILLLAGVVMSRRKPMAN